MQVIINGCALDSFDRHSTNSTAGELHERDIAKGSKISVVVPNKMKVKENTWSTFSMNQDPQIGNTSDSDLHMYITDSGTSELWTNGGRNKSVQERRNIIGRKNMTSMKQCSHLGSSFVVECDLQCLTRLPLSETTNRSIWKSGNRINVSLLTITLQLLHYAV